MRSRIENKRTEKVTVIFNKKGQLFAKTIPLWIFFPNSVTIKGEKQ